MHVMYVADSMQWLSSLLPCLLAILETCSADFVFTIDLDRFTTNGRCDPGSFNTRCETYLNIYCLRGPSSQQSRDRGHCPLGKSAFGRLYEASTPTTRTITSPQPWPGAFQLFIQAADDDQDSPDDLLDNIFIHLTLSRTDGFNAMSAYTGIRNRVTVNMRFQVRCDNNYYDSDCTAFCLAMDDDINGHYTCNSDGSFRCRTGFENPGNNCRDRVTSCSADPCMNGGSCAPVGLDSHVCACAPGYTGENCEMEIDECQTEPCQNGATCIDMFADYLCECVLGFEDRNCSTNTDECTGVECAGNSTCQDLINGFMCVCNPGFEGDNCTAVQTPVIIGAVVGGVGGLLILLLLIVIAACIIANRRLTNKEHTSDSKTDTVEADRIYDGVEDVESNRVNKDEQEIKLSANPVYGVRGNHPTEVDTATNISYSAFSSSTARLHREPNRVNKDEQEIKLSANPVYGVRGNHPTEVDTATNVSYSAFSSSTARLHRDPNRVNKDEQEVKLSANPVYGVRGNHPTEVDTATNVSYSAFSSSTARLHRDPNRVNKDEQEVKLSANPVYGVRGNHPTEVETATNVSYSAFSSSTARLHREPRLTPSQSNPSSGVNRAQEENIYDN